MHLVTPETMQRMDRRTIDDIGVPGPVLMDRAAAGAVEALVDHFAPRPGAAIGILCGPGNNGGDGLAMAAMLADRGFQPYVVVLAPKKELSDDARCYYDVADALVDRVVVAGDEDAVERAVDGAPAADLWCDALLGTGIDRPVGGRYRTAVEFLKRQPAPVMAVDIPSGVEGRTGAVLGVAAEAELTATFGFAKIGQCLDPARGLCGALRVIDIGIPDRVRDAIGTDGVGLDKNWLSDHTVQRPLTHHKGDAGRTLHIGGRAETCGAIALSARGALVGGAGLVTVATDRRTQPAVPTATPEVMARGLFDFERGSIDEDRLREALAAADTAVVGPGLGTDETARQILRIILDTPPAQLVADADALNLAARHDQIRSAFVDAADQTALVVTPHPGEMARLVDGDIDEVLADPIGAARRIGDEFGAVAVHKTAATCVAAPDGRMAVNRTGNPGMATGGMGDALTGLIAASFGDRQDPFQAACAGVVVHGLAGDRAAGCRGHRGTTVRDLLDEVPAVWQAVEK